jgi:DNA-binding NarL/FixJ family response regulator
MEKGLRYCIVFVLLSVGFSGNSVFSQGTDNLKLQSYLVNEYDLNNQNWSVSQCPVSKNIYSANSEGLFSYNGITWKKHTSNDNFPVRSVHVHQNGDVFTGSFEEFGYWIQNGRKELEYISLTNMTDVEKNDEIWKIYSSHDKIYFQSFTSIYVYDFKSVEKVMAPYTLLFLHQPGERFIAQILDTGLFIFEDRAFTAIEGSELFADKKVHAIIPYVGDKLIICTDNQGLFLYDGKDFSHFVNEASAFLRENTCNAAVKLSDSTLAFGSILSGVIITDMKGNILRHYDTSNGLGNNTVLSLYVDHDKGLWIGLDDGINYTDLLLPYDHYRAINGTLGTIYAMLAHEGYLYIGTNHGLFMAGIENNKGVYSFHDVQFIPGSHGQVWTLELFDNQIICGHNDGTFLVVDGRLEKISMVTGGWTYELLEDIMIGGCYTGITLYDKNETGKWQFRNKIQHFNEPVRHLRIDYLGYAWASHQQKGLFRVEFSDDLFSAIDVIEYPKVGNKSYNIRVFKINNRVVFTNAEDIYTFDFVQNEIVPFTSLTANLGEYRSATQILHYEKNTYWLVKEDKMALFEIKLDFSAKKIQEIIKENINTSDRLIQFVSLNDNKLLISNPQSFDAYNLPLIRDRNEIARLNIDRLFFYGERDTIVVTDLTGMIEIPSNVNNLTVNFSDPSGFMRTNKQYQYRIREIDPVWHLMSERGYATVNNLQHGSYQFEIHREPDAFISTSFIIKKPWYLSRLAILFYVAAFVLIVWGVIMFFRFEIKRHKEIALMEVRQLKLERELDYRSYELMLTIRHLILKDNTLKDLQEQINAIKSQSSKYPVKYVKNMERIIKQGQGSQNIDLENAIQNLKLTQQGVFKELKERYPDLTSNDLRLCSYLRLNFNTKEIAQLLSISFRAVEIARHRLRKKLKLKRDDNLFEFLMKIESTLANKD